MIEELKKINFKPIQKLGYTLESWKEDIARMFRFSKTNGITEGLHNKMEMISRRRTRLTKAVRYNCKNERK